MNVVAINTSPRTNWNTAQLVKEAAKGAESAGAKVQYFDLYRQEKFTGCISCFGCKREPNEGWCICRDGLYPILQAIKDADAVIIGTPNYLSQPSAGFHALYERLMFQNITYQKEKWNYHENSTPVLFILTSNSPEESYAPDGFNNPVLESCKRILEGCIGPTEVLISGDTLQVKDYSRFNWTVFSPLQKQERHDEVFPEELKKACQMGRELVDDRS